MKTPITKPKSVLNSYLNLLLRSHKASIRLFNMLNQPCRRLGTLTVRQFIRDWPRERLEKQIYGFGRVNRAELFLILKQHPELWEYAETLLDPPPERTCVHCGCTDSRACAAGCHWIFKHKATPTGVCSACMYVQMGIVVGKFSLMHQGTGKIWLEVNSGPSAGEGMQVDEVKLEAAVYKFYRKEF